MTSSKKSLPILYAVPPAGAPAGAPGGAPGGPTRETVEARTLSAAQRFLDDGQADEAARKLAPLAEDPTTPVRAHAGLLYAGLLLMTGRPAEAIAVLERVPTAPSFPLDEGYRWMLMACALRTARRYEDALAAAHRAVEHGTTAGRLLVLADAQKHAGLLADASATLLRLLEKEPRHATALAQLAGYRNLAGATDDGARAFATFRSLADQGADSARNEAFYFATRGDLEATVEALRRALALEPDATRGYIDDEIELDRFRDSDALRALLP